MKFLCDSCKAKYQIGDERVAGKTVRMKCRRCGHLIEISAQVTESSVARRLPTDPAAPHTTTMLAGPIFEEESDENTRIVDPSLPKAPGPPIGSKVPAPAVSQPFSLTTPRASRPPPPAPGAPVAPRPFAPRPLTSAPAPRPAAPPRPAGATTSSRAPWAPRPTASAGPPRPAAAAAPAPHIEAPPPSAPEDVAEVFTRAVADAPPHVPAAAPGGENWYVGIGGVPLGPIRLSVVREKAAAGVVDGESLVWREGFDEWLPLKNFPELLEVVSEARAAPQTSTRKPSTSGMGRVAPPVGVPVSLPPEPRSPARAPSDRPPVAAWSPSAPSAPAPAAPVAAAPPHEPTALSAQSAPLDLALAFGGLPASSPVASAQPEGLIVAPATIGALADPFGPSSAPATTASAAALPLATPEPAPFSSGAFVAPESHVPVAPRRASMHPAAYAFIAMAAVFGGVAAFLLLSRPDAPPQIVVVQGAAPAVTLANDVPPPPTEVPNAGEPVAAVDTSLPAAPPVPGAKAGATDPKAGSTKPDTTAAPIDTSGFGNPSGVAGPSATAPDTSGGASGGGQLSQGEISAVVAQNQPLIRRKCWQPALDGAAAAGPKTARVSAQLVIGPNGSVQSASASGAATDFPGLASCIAGRIKGWKFPASGGPTPVNVPFVFASQ